MYSSTPPSYNGTQEHRYGYGQMSAKGRCTVCATFLTKNWSRGFRMRMMSEVTPGLVWYGSWLRMSDASV